MSGTVMVNSKKELRPAESRRTAVVAPIQKSTADRPSAPAVDLSFRGVSTSSANSATASPVASPTAATFSPPVSRGTADRRRTLQATLAPELLRHADMAKGVAFSADGRFVAVAEADGKLSISDFTTDRLVHQPKFSEPDPNEDGPSSYPVAFSSNGSRVAVGCKNRISVFDPTTGAKVVELAHESVQASERFQAVCFSADGERVIGVATNGTLVWSLGAPAAPEVKLQFTLPVPTQEDIGFVVSPDGETLAYLVPKQGIDLFDLRTGKPTRRITAGLTGTLLDADWSADGSLLSVWNDSRRLTFFNTQDWSERFHFDDFHATECRFGPDGTFVAASRDGCRFYVVGDERLYEVGVLREHPRAIQFSPDGKQLIALRHSAQSRAEVFRLSWSQEEETLDTGETRVLKFDVSRDGKHVAWLEQAALKLYSVPQAKQIGTVSLKEWPSMIRFSQDGKQLFVRAEPGSVDWSLYSVPELTLLHAGTVENGKTNDKSKLKDVYFTADGKSLLFFQEDRARIWDLATKKFLDKELAAWEMPLTVDRVEVPRDKQDVLFNQHFDSTSIRRLADGVELKRWRSDFLDCLAVSPDGTRMATCGHSRIDLWNVARGEFEAQLETDSKWNGPLAFSPDGRLLLTSRSDGSLDIWSYDDRQRRGSCQAHPEGLRDIRFVPGSSVFYTMGKSDNSQGEFSSIKRWDLVKLLKRLPTSASPGVPTAEPAIPVTGALAARRFEDASGESAGLTDDERSVFQVDYAGNVKTFDRVTGVPVAQYSVGRGVEIDFSADGKWLAASYPFEPTRGTSAGPKQARVRIWDLASGLAPQELLLETTKPECIRFSPDGTTLAVGSGSDDDDVPGELAVWEVATGKRILHRREKSQGQATRQQGSITNVRFSPSGRMVAYSDHEPRVFVRDLQGDKLLQAFPSPHGVNDIAFSPDESQLAFCCGEGDGGTIALYDIAGGRKHPEFQVADRWDSSVGPLRDDCLAIAFSPRGDVLAAAVNGERNEAGLRFWTLPDRQEVRRIAFEKTHVSDGRLSFSADAKRLYSGNFGDFRVWHLNDLFNVALQRDLKTLEDRRCSLDYDGDLVRVRFIADDRNLAALPVMTQPVIFSFSNSSQVTDAGLAHLRKQTNLAGLGASYCDLITVAGLSQLSDLPLRKLDMTGPHGSSEALALAGRFKKLESLRLSTTGMSQLTPLGDLVHLRELELHDAGAPDISLKPLGKLTELESLSLTYSLVDDPSFAELVPLKKLRTLHIKARGTFTGAGLGYLAGNEGLETLDLESSDMNDHGLRQIAKFKRLRRLRLKWTGITDQGLAAVAGLTALEELDLPDRITDAGLAHLAELVRLRKLDLSTQSISDKGLLHLVKLDALEELVLASKSAYLSDELKKSPPGSKINGSGLAAFAGATKLTRLDLRAVSGLTDAGLRGLAEMTQLKSLALPPQITDAGLVHLARLVDLTELTLDDTKVTDAGIAQLAKLKSLESLSLKNVGITDAAVPQFAAFPALTGVDIEGCKLSPDAEKKIYESLRNDPFGSR